MQVWQNQHFVNQRNAYNLDQLYEYDISERTHSGRDGALTLAALKNDTTASKDQDRRHGSMSNLETSEDDSPVPSQQALGSVVSQGETGRDVPTQDSQELKSLVPDQVCTCAACLWSYWCPSHLKRESGHPERLSWKFGCRITGCQWTTDSAPQVVGGVNALQHLLWHEKKRSHYGKPGDGDFRCLETGCKFVTKRFNDLKRHSSSKHCIKPQIFKCAVLDCKYHETGFARKDKRKSHYQNVHQGKPQPGKANQAIKPKVKDGA